jgi:heme/copper-type cytochrome/quinol oxidase subunit 3
MIGLVATMGVAYAALVYSYFYLRLLSPGGEWPQGGIPKPDLLWPGVVFAVLLAAGAAQAFSGRAFRAGWRTGAVAGAAKVLLFGGVFLVGLLVLIGTLPFTATDTAYGSAFWVLMFYLAVTAGVGLALQIGLLARLPRHAHDRHGFTGLQVQITALYWYFAVAAGAVVFGVLYVSPHVL